MIRAAAAATYVFNAPTSVENPSDTDWWNTASL